MNTTLEAIKAWRSTYRPILDKPVDALLAAALDRVDWLVAEVERLREDANGAWELIDTITYAEFDDWIDVRDRRRVIHDALVVEHQDG